MHFTSTNLLYRKNWNSFDKIKKSCSIGYGQDAIPLTTKVVSPLRQQKWNWKKYYSKKVKEEVEPLKQETQKLREELQSLKVLLMKENGPYHLSGKSENEYLGFLSKRVR